MFRLHRRDFLHAGAVAGLGLGLADSPGAKAEAAVIGNGVSCILLHLVGGPSQLDTWDMKPDAPSEIRGPYKPIKTNVSGIEICENFPRMARHADKYAIIRSCYRTGEAVHGVSHPQTGSVEAARASFELGGESTETRDRYGRNRFGESCLLARRRIEAGERFVSVNMFETVFNQITWDIHGFKPFSPMGSYREVVGPMFDMAYSSLLEDLSERGLLSSTMVVAMGEFGRTPRINMVGGRDHWPECFSVLMGGGPLKGGQVIGSSDKIAGSPKDRPASMGEIIATIYQGLGIPQEMELAGLPRVEQDSGVIKELLE